LLIALGVVFLSLVFLGIWYWSASALDQIERERAATVDALRFLQRARPRIEARNARREALLARYRTPAPPLATYVGEQAQAAHVEITETVDRPPSPVGLRLTERSVQLRLRRVNLQALVDFMDRIDSATFPVAITAVRIHRRFGERNTYDVDDLVVSTWDQASEAEQRRRQSQTQGRDRGRGGGSERGSDREREREEGGPRR
jgi:hypothetical protein